MMPDLRPLAVLTVLIGLAGCAAADSLNRLADQAETRSTCHTSTGDWVGGSSCTVEWSAMKTTSSTTTTTVTTTTTPAADSPRTGD